MNDSYLTDNLAQLRRSLTRYLFAGNTPLSGRSARNGSKFSKKIGTRRHRNLSAAIALAEAKLRPPKKAEVTA